MNRIFGIGLTRTGTSSLRDALEILGFPTVHWPPPDRVEEDLLRFSGLVDMPVTTRYRELDRRFPGSKFILTRRKRESWLDSCRRWFETHPPSPARSPYRLELYGRTDFDADTFIRVYESHHAEVEEYFRGRPGDLLTLDICSGEGWEKLAPFLGADIPGFPFPNANRNRKLPAPGGAAPAAGDPGHPRVSCLTVTRDRPEQLHRAVEHYTRQTWPNKELVVVVDRRGETAWAEPYFRGLGRPDLRWMISPKEAPLGALRNISVAMATGEYVCIWDDDDWYHPQRLERQMNGLLGAGAQASFLGEGLHYFADSGDLFVTTWPSPGLPSSMLCRRSRVPRFPELDPRHGPGGQFPARDFFMNSMNFMKWESVHVLEGHPYLCTTVYHGRNRRDRPHHVSLAFTQCQEGDALSARLQGLGQQIREYFPGPHPREVVCRDGARRLLG